MAEKTGTSYFTPADAASQMHFELLKLREVSRWVMSQLHPEGVTCPACSTVVTDPDRIERLVALEQIRCQADGCQKKFTAVSGTFLNGSKLEIREVFLLAFLLHLEVPARKIAEQLGVDVATVRTWADKFRALQEVVRA